LAAPLETPSTAVVHEPPGGGVRRRYLALVGGQARGPWAALQRLGLCLASLPYGLAVRLRNALFDRGWRRSERVAVPVVSVGNLTAGGTGKTPCVEHVAAFYRGLGRRVAILSRGYGAEGGRNDEALVLEENLPDVPHLQGADRVALARIAVEELESEVLVLDDGFQHRRLARDLDLVLLDASEPWGHGHLLPRGLLREPPSGLRRADVVLLTRCDQADEDGRRRLRERVAKLAPGLPVAESVHRPVGLVDGERRETGLELLHGRPLAGFCGLGNPDAFHRTLLGLGPVCAFRVYPDHHAYSRADVEALQAWARSLPADAVVATTQKDLVKVRLTALGGRPLWAVRVRLEVSAGREELERRLRRTIGLQ
jgi:tetraacyldisaccharide 4'-kinase